MESHQGKGPYIAYTDGACKNNQAPGDQSGGWGVVFVDGREFSGGGYGTNQRFELIAAIEALKHTPPGSDVIIRSDSTYLINAFNQDWFSGWRRRGWVTSQKKPVANRDFWEELYALAQERNVRWEKVSGHSGDRLNERADRLAVAAIPGSEH